MANKSGYAYNTDVGIYKNRVPRLMMEFLEMEASNVVSPNTISQHYYCLKDFFQYVSWSAGLCGKNVRTRAMLAKNGAEDFNIAEVPEELILGCTSQDLTSYKSYLHTVLNPGADEDEQVAINKVATARVKVYAVKAFYRWLFEADYLDKNPMLIVRADKMPEDKDGKQSISLPLHEVKMLLSNVSEKFFERDLCILLFFLTTGVRLSELVSINVDDVSTEEKMLTIRHGKGGARRRVPLSDGCIEQYKRCIAARKRFHEAIHYVERDEDVKPLFVSERNKRITQRRVQQIVATAVQKAGLSGKGYSPHKLRHTAATMMYNNGVDLNNIKAILGHNSIQTTTIYAHVDTENKRAAVEHNPVADLNLDDFAPTSAQ